MVSYFQRNGPTNLVPRVLSLGQLGENPGNEVGDQLDFLEEPHLLILLLYNISSIISSLLILYIVDKETGKYFLNQV